jgi:hypothetical protein
MIRNQRFNGLPLRYGTELAITVNRFSSGCAEATAMSGLMKVSRLSDRHRCAHNGGNCTLDSRRHPHFFDVESCFPRPSHNLEIWLCDVLVDHLFS